MARAYTTEILTELGYHVLESSSSEGAIYDRLHAQRRLAVRESISLMRESGEYAVLLSRCSCYH
jgi:hypothetical protein